LTEAIIAYVIANILDVVSTNRGMQKGARELNPVMRWAMDKFGKAWVVPKFALAGAALGIFLHLNLVWVVWVGAALYGGVALNNFRIGRKLKDK
jgi:predicted exporter